MSLPTPGREGVPAKRRRRKSPEPVPEVCSIPGCGKPGYSRQWCQAHYSRWQRSGDPLPKQRILPDEFWARVVPTGFCWEWRGTITHEGYGVVSVLGQQHKAHRRAYELLVGPIPEGLHIDHLCRNRACVNPDHLEPVTALVNARRGFSPPVIASRRTHCVNDHEFTPENTRICPDGGRDCRTCDRERKRKERAA